jgi:hypothetical protein
MLKKIALATALLGFLATPALAGHCPADAKAIEAALAKATNLSDAQKAEVTALKDEGMALHNAGDHRASEAKMAEAMRKILLEM